jgi:hypothetical protein
MILPKGGNIMAGIGNKLKSIFGGKKEDPFNEPVRLPPRRIEEPPVEDETGQRWKQAKKWREDKELEKPLVKRNRL